MKNQEQGFVQFIIIVIGAVIALAYLGLNPVSIWNDAVLPLLISAGKIFVAIIDFIVNVTTNLFGIFGK